ncbi:hypothetical protein GWK47_051714 [Chionoecetes opilio]|uniref:Uncharacterized protein n=1 Tax=Chionoecetes opilio TaxID=41210 RepID=A0A8J4Y0M9_CHIOP|nr:hypothetical protein GWK47_051714 [Chionoecetes opilio]
MLPSRRVRDTSPQRQEVEKMSSPWWGYPGGTTTPSLLLTRTTSPSPRLTHRLPWWLVGVVVAVVVMLDTAPCCSLEARCPPDNVTDSYCRCGMQRVRSGIQINIKCDFQMKEDVQLTEALYPFRESKALSASVRVANATSVSVTQAFLADWLKILSVGLDLWNCGTVTLASAPPVYLRFPHSFSTFVGVGLVGCRVPELPARLLRDRVTASLRIKNSVVGTVRRGLLHAVRKVRYIVVEDSVVEEVEGSVAAEGSFTLSQLDKQRWNGLVLANVTINSLGPGAFTLTHKAQKRDSTQKVVVKDCRVRHIGRGGITVQGDVAVTMKDNSFGELEDEALQINVSRDFKFEGNLVAAAREGALRGLTCHNLTKLDTNMIYVTSERNVTGLRDPTFTPFPPSCGQSQVDIELGDCLDSVPDIAHIARLGPQPSGPETLQVFRVVNNALPLPTTVFSRSTWVLLGILMLLLLAAGGILYRWRENNKLLTHNLNNFHSYNGVTSSARYQANQQEVNMVQQGVTNPTFDRTVL